MLLMHRLELQTVDLVLRQHDVVTLGRVLITLRNHDSDLTIARVAILTAARQP